MADDYATAFASHPGARTARPPAPPKPARARPGPIPWNALPFRVPEPVRTVNDLAVTHLLIRPLERADAHLARTRDRVLALRRTARTLLFDEP